MGFFSRIAQLLKSNINDLISRSEDPEKMLTQIIIDMGQQLIEAKKQVAGAIADEKRLFKHYRREAAAGEQWEKKAMLAVKSDNDQLAKEALLRKKEHDAHTAQLKEQWEKQRAVNEQLKTALRALNNKIGEAKRKKGVLIARKRRAEAMKNIQETMSGLKDDSAFEAFDRMAEKIDQLEAETEAGAEIAEEYSGDMLKHKFSELEANHGADEELEALKRKMGVLPAEPAFEARVQTENEDTITEEELVELEDALQSLKRREL